jgi:hypothetical protein
LVARTDSLRDLAVLRCDTALPALAGPLTSTDNMQVRAPVTATGHAVLEDRLGGYQFLTAVGQWAGGTARGEVSLGRVIADRIVPGMSGAPVVCDADGAVAGVVSGRYCSVDGWPPSTAWVARIEDLMPLLAGISDVGSKGRLKRHLKPICVRYGFKSADRANEHQIHRAHLEHILRDGEELIAFHRWRRIINDDRGVAFTTWGVRLRHGHHRVDFPYGRIEDYEFREKSESEFSGGSYNTWNYFEGGLAGNVQISLPLTGTNGPTPWQIATCIREIRDLFRSDPTLQVRI